MGDNKWKEVKLGDIVKFQNGGSWKQDAYSEIGIPVVQVTNLKDGLISNEKIKYLDEKYYEKYLKHRLEEDDILIATVGSHPTQPSSVVGKTSIVREQFVGAFLNQNAVLMRTLDLNKYDQNFLFYLCRSHIMRDFIISRAKGSANQVRMAISHLKEFSFSIPKIEKQRRISSILKSLDEKIEINNQMNHTLEEMAQAIFKEWFVEFNFPNEDGVPYKDNGGEMVESELGEIPEGWRVEELRNLLRFIKGKKPKNISEGKINKNQQQYLTIKSYTGTDQLFADIDKIILTEPKDSVMVMDGASSGTIFYGKKGIVASTIARIDSKKLDDDFIYYLLKSYESEIKQHLTGSAIPHTDKEFIYRIQIALPLKNFNFDIFSNIRNKIIEVKEENETLIKTRDTLLPKLMSGEVRV